MLLPQSFIDQVKQATDIVKLIKDYTELKPIGDGIWQGRCPNPNHNDKDPSFRVWEKEQSWACMGCHYGKKDLSAKKHEDKIYGSDCFAFIQWITKGKVNWKQAVLQLAKRAQVPEPSNENERLYNMKKILTKSYTKSLHGKPYNYLIERGLSKKEIKEWSIGFDGTKIIFPLFDRYKNVLGFTKRWVDKVPEDQPKYKNSSNSKIFNKSMYLYGIHKIDDNFDEVRITEGAMDVILPEKYGVKNIFATLGTAFTEGHIEIIKHYGKIPVFCMDGDRAGLASINKAINILAQNGIYSKILVLPDGMDMADLANKYKYDTEKYINDNAITYGFYEMKKILSMYDSKMVELKMKLYPEIVNILETIPDYTEKHIIEDLIKQRIGIDFSLDIR